MGADAWIDYCRNIQLDLVELFGSYFVIEHVISEARARNEERLYRIYASDMLKAIAEGVGFEVNMRYADIINDEVDTRTGDEIAAEIIEKAGLRGA